MTNRNNEPKPDDRSDNVEKLQNIVEDTIQNIEKSHGTMKRSTGKDKEAIKAKNQRREETIDNLREEIKDEYNYNNLDE